MAWTTPATHVAGTTLTAATLNAQLRDNFNAAFPVGSIHYFMQAGTTSETLINGFALEMNAVSVLRATYVNLNSLLSGLGYPFGTVDGTHMTLPDAKGRALYHMASGGHVDVNAIADTDGLAVASRSPQHNSTPNLTLSNHTHTITDPQHSHPEQSNSGVGGGLLGIVGTSNVNGAQGSNPNTGLASTGITGTNTPSTNTVGGTIGVGGTRPNDLTPWLVAGVYAVKT